MSLIRPTLSSSRPLWADYSNTHKNWWECDTGIAYLVANIPSEGWQHSGSTQHLKIYNLHDPANPVYVRDFGLVGQQPGATTFEGPVNPPSGIHGPISGYPMKDRVYMPYGVGSNGVVQIVDRRKLLYGNPNDVLSPQISYWTLVPDSPGDQGGHTSFPIYKKHQDLLLVTSEEGVNECTIRRRELPRSHRLARRDNERKEAHSTVHPDSHAQPGRFLSQGRAVRSSRLQRVVHRPYYGKLAIISWFNAGVRVWDIRDPSEPVPVAYFIPAPNENTIANCLVVNGNTVDCKNAIQTNNVELDDRGLIYIADRAGTGMHILQLTGKAKEVVSEDDDHEQH